MEKNTKSTSEEVRSSVASLYAELLSKRRQEHEEREERKALEKAKKEEAKKEKEDEKTEKLSKKERRERELEAWKEVIVGLTGDDLEYTSQKKSKKKYRKWIGDDDDNKILQDKPKKVKKKNYQKEFDAELNMLKTLVADQNKFTAELQKRFQNAAGPATKDAMPLNKTMVDLAAAINASRGNSLGVLREIGNIKKTIADLYMKQKKLDSDTAGSGNFDTTDLGLMGSNAAAEMFADLMSPSQSGSSSMAGGMSASPITAPTSNPNPVYQSTPQQPVANVPTVPSNQQPSAGVSSFDPDSWEGPNLSNNMPYFETIPHSTVVEWDKKNNTARFKAVSDETGEELVGCPVPTTDPMKLKFNEKDKVVKGVFDEVYKLDIIDA